MRRSGFAWVVMLLLLLAATSAMAGPAGFTTRFTQSPEGGDANGGSEVPFLSADGRYLVFFTWATNLRPGGNEPGRYRVDLVTGDWRQVPCPFGGRRSPCGVTDISAHGRYVAMEAGWESGPMQVAVYDFDTGVTTFASATPSGDLSTGNASDGHISPDGRYLVFQSDAEDLVAPHSHTQHTAQVYVRDLLTRTTRQVSVDRFGDQPWGGISTPGGVSGDGRFVTFSSNAYDITAGTPRTGHGYGYVRDLATNTTELVTRDANGQPVEGGAGPISYRGDRVLIAARGRDVDPNHQTDAPTLYVHDRGSGSNSMVAVDSEGNPSLLSPGPARMSEDGTIVVFESRANDLDHLVQPENTLRGADDLYLHDLNTGETTRVSIGADGNTEERLLAGWALDGRASSVFFSSYWDNVVPGDANYAYDVFRRQYPSRSPSTVAPAEIDLPPPEATPATTTTTTPPAADPQPANDPQPAASSDPRPSPRGAPQAAEAETSDRPTGLTTTAREGRRSLAPDDQAVYDEAVAMIDRGELDEATRLLRELQERNPTRDLEPLFQAAGGDRRHAGRHIPGSIAATLIAVTGAASVRVRRRTRLPATPLGREMLKHFSEQASHQEPRVRP